MGERTMNSPTWWIARRAKELGIPVEVLRHVAETFERLRYRRGDKTRCEGCGRLLIDYGRDDETVNPSVHDEDGIHLCFPCAGVDENTPGLYE